MHALTLHDDLPRFASTAGSSVTNGAGISAASAVGYESTHGNGAGEDDNDSASFTVSGTRVAGTPAALVCPVGTTLYDWDGVSWPAGTTSGGAALTAIGPASFNIAVRDRKSKRLNSSH